MGKGIHPHVTGTLLRELCRISVFLFDLSMQGTPFADICELTDVSEGLIVRTIVRLDETCREFRNAASIMGNSALHKKMETASNAIKRDIVFAASLYVTGI
jgi:antiviral helicase SKI2